MPRQSVAAALRVGNQTIYKLSDRNLIGGRRENETNPVSYSTYSIAFYRARDEALAL